MATNDDEHGGVTTTIRHFIPRIYRTIALILTPHHLSIDQ
jgi:hypothetical protein